MEEPPSNGHLHYRNVPDRGRIDAKALWPYTRLFQARIIIHPASCSSSDVQPVESVGPYADMTTFGKCPIQGAGAVVTCGTMTFSELIIVVIPTHAVLIVVDKNFPNQASARYHGPSP